MAIPLKVMCVNPSVVSDSLRPARLLCPWDSPGENTGVGCHFLLQGIFPTQGSNPGLPHCRHVLYHLSHQGSLCCPPGDLSDPGIKPVSSSSPALAGGFFTTCRILTIAVLIKAPVYLIQRVGGGAWVSLSKVALQDDLKMHEANPTRV